MKPFSSPHPVSDDRRLTSRRSLLLAGALAVVPPLVRAQAAGGAWPAKPITFIVSWPAGGSADTAARYFSERISKKLGQAIIIDNRPGNGGKIGTAAVARAQPDGYTFLFSAPSEITIAAATVRAMPYDPQTELQPITQIVSSTMVLIATPEFRPNTLQELVAFAKANPQGVNYASYGNNTLNHLCGEQLNLVAGIKALHVPYKGGSAAWADLMGGRVQYMFEAASAALPLVQAGKVKALAVVSPDRLTAAPNVPTMKEAGFAEVGSRSWSGLFAPAKTPMPIVARMHDEVLQVLRQPETAKWLEERGLVAAGTTPAEFGQLVGTEIRTWKEVVAKAGLTLE